MARYVAFALALLSSGLVLAGCEPDEYAVLISARSESSVDTVRVTVVPLDGRGRPFPSGSFPVRRTAEDIRDNEPIRIAVQLDRPTEVMIHLEAFDFSGARLVASRCYAVRGVVEDRVLLVAITSAIDVDGDGWVNNPGATCYERGADGSDQLCSRHQCAAAEDRDCDDTDPDVHPGAQEWCNDGSDQDCDGVDAPCDDQDMDGWRKCSRSDVGGMFGGTCDCNDDFDTIFPLAEEMCGDGIDQDCDGEDLHCDNDNDGYRSDRDCNDDDPSIHPGAAEVCTPEGGTSVDEDCDRLVDELIDCAPDDLDKDGVVGCGHPGAPPPPDCDCNDCDSGIRPGAMDRCGDDIDADCDGADAPCPTGDMDEDGVVGPPSGADCDDGDDRVSPFAPERCGDGVSQSCSTDLACEGNDPDGDGWVEAGECAADPDRYHWKDELCNALDDDCDETTDEVMSPPAALGMISLPHGLTGCVGPNPTVPDCASTSSACVVDYASNLAHCGGCRLNCNPDGSNVADRCVDAVCDCSTEAGTAACMGGWKCCGSGCEDIGNDPENCGDCGASCNDGRPGFEPRADSCQGGDCRCGSGPPCADSPYQLCCPTAAGGDASCVGRTDPSNCGVCGNVCGPNMTCADSATGPRCVCNETYLADCDGDVPATGCETDTRSDRQHCGMCGNECTRPNATARCAASSCQIDACNSGWGDCDGTDSNGCETRLNTVSNCGACGTVCNLPNAVEVCTGGACGIGSCEDGWADCDGDVANGCETQTNTNANCGGCGIACNLANASETCSTGSCRITSCDAGWDDCDGSHGNGCETSLTTLGSCGACGVSCALANATESCTSGSCVITTCNSGYGDCDGTASNGCETRLDTVTDCRSCGTMCTMPSNATATCGGSGCTWTCNAGYGDCDGSAGNGCETSLDTTSNCRACGTSCDPRTNATAMCTMSGCSWSCDAGYGDCDTSRTNGCEASLNTVSNCGACGTSCTAPPNASATCTMSGCSFTCDAGYGDCDSAAGNGCEASLNTVSNCGACGTSCTAPANATATCTMSGCSFTCDDGWGDCNSDASDGCEQQLNTDSHCTACGNRCNGVDRCCDDGSGTLACRQNPLCI